MKFKEIMRVTPARQNGPVHNYFPYSIKTTVDILNERPGLSAREVARKFGYTRPEDIHRVSVALNSSTKAKNAKIKAKKLDGRVRYYPGNYRLSSDTPVAMVPEERVEDIPRKVQPNNLEDRMKEFAWATGENDLTTLKRFLAWTKEQDDAR